jgi:DNA repair exonuclease SbcCD ATPase subunit
MKVVNLQVENIKKIKAVDITPDGNMVIISGKNEQGKTTVLDSIWWAIGGTKNIQDEPLRTGQKKGKITLDLGDMIATRKFTASGSTLEVTNKQGMSYKSPQAVLDKLISRFSFDIQEFASTKDNKAQVDTLLSIVEIPIDPKKLETISGVAIGGTSNPLDLLNKTYKAVFDERTIVNRELDKAKKKLEDMPKAEPAEAVSITDLVAEKDELELHNRANQQKRNHRETLQAGFDSCKITLQATTDRIAKLKEEIKELEKREQLEEIDRDEALRAVEDYDKELALLQDNDLTEINTKISTADETNRKAQAYIDYQSATTAKDEKQAESDGYTAKLEAIKAYKDELMQAVKFPIEGLGFANGGVTYLGLPFAQASGEQKLMVSTAIAMALNPDFRVLRINDRAAFDSAHWAIIEKMTADKDYQVWSELVDESGKVGIVIEDGTVKANKESE